MLFPGLGDNVGGSAGAELRAVPDFDGRDDYVEIVADPGLGEGLVHAAEVIADRLQWEGHAGGVVRRYLGR